MSHWSMSVFASCGWDCRTYLVLHVSWLLSAVCVYVCEYIIHAYVHCMHMNDSVLSHSASYSHQYIDGSESNECSCLAAVNPTAELDPWSLSEWNVLYLCSRVKRTNVYPLASTRLQPFVSQCHKLSITLFSGLFIHFHTSVNIWSSFNHIIS